MFIQRLFAQLNTFIARVFPRVQLGVRGLVITRDNEVLLVRHTYIEGWYLPGGSVDKKESFERALVRELFEECGVKVHKAELFHLYFDARYAAGHHIALYIAREFQLPENFSTNLEIKEARLFSVETLPEGTSAATRRRILEYLGRQEKAPLW